MHEILAALALALGCGKLAGWVSARLKMPPVVGEIVAGILLANFGASLGGRFLSESDFLRELSELGVILLLFGVGLDGTLGQVVKVGVRALLVACVGVAAPFLLMIAAWKFGLIDDRLPNGSESLAVPLFVAATLTATSVGITARLLGEAKLLHSRTGQVILNAAVIDDVLGLLILAALSSFIASQNISLLSLGTIAGKALAFFGLLIPVGLFLFPPLIKSLKSDESFQVFGLIACFSGAWFGTVWGLAPIVGAFFAGLLIEEPSGRMCKTIDPLIQFLAPLFFVLIGAQIDLATVFGVGSHAFLETLIIVVLAIAGKLLCALVSGPGTDRVAVGLGMAPRGEVGLIFAMTGRSMEVLTNEMFAILVFVVLLTTLVPSIGFERWLARKGARR